MLYEKTIVCRNVGHEFCYNLYLALLYSRSLSKHFVFISFLGSNAVFGFIGFKGHGTLNLSWLVLLVLILNCNEANTCVHLKQFSSLNGRHQGGNGVLMWKPNTPSVFEVANSFDHTLSLNLMTSQSLRAAYCSLSLQATECFDIWFNSQKNQ